MPNRSLPSPRGWHVAGRGVAAPTRGDASGLEIRRCTRDRGALQQFAGHFAPGQQVHGPARAVDQAVVRLQTERVIDNRAEIFDAHFPRRGVLGLGVRAANHLAVPIAPTRQQHALRLGPVVARRPC